MTQTDAPVAHPRILLAEDDVEMRRVLIEALRQDHYEIIEVDSGVALLDQVTRAKTQAELPALIVSDVRMPGMSGLAVVGAIRARGFRIPIILITAFSTEDTLNEAFRVGATAVLSKPFDLDDLRAAVCCLLPSNEAETRPHES
jgi:CheY-like chemotaxis protein